MLMREWAATAAHGFNPTRLSAGNEIHLAALLRGVELVSIQPGYPPGMRSAQAPSR